MPAATGQGLITNIIRQTKTKIQWNVRADGGEREGFQQRMERIRKTTTDIMDRPVGNRHGRIIEKTYARVPDGVSETDPTGEARHVKFDVA